MSEIEKIFIENQSEMLQRSDISKNSRRTAGNGRPPNHTTQSFR